MMADLEHKSNNMVLLPAGEVPVVGGYDLVVVGGGPSGCFAALAAARMGSSTCVEERNGCLGGPLDMF